MVTIQTNHGLIFTVVVPEQQPESQRTQTHHSGVLEAGDILEAGDSAAVAPPHEVVSKR